MREVLANHRAILAYITFSLYTFQNFGVLNAYFVHEGVSVSQFFYWGSTLANILVLIACALLGNRIAHCFERAQTIIFAGLLCSFGTLFSGLIPAADALFPFAFAFSVLATGAGTGLLYFELAAKFLAMEPDHIIKAALATCFGALLVNSFLSLIAGAVSLIVVAILPCMTSFLLIEGTREGVFLKSKKSSTDDKHLAPLMVKLALCIVMFSLVAGLVKGLYIDAQPTWNLALTAILVLVTVAMFGLVALSAFFTKRFDAVALYRVVFFIVVVCLAVLLATLGNAGMVFAVQRASGDLFRILLFVFALKLCLRTAYNPLFILGSTLALSKVASFAISLVINYMPVLQNLSDSTLMALGLGLIVAMAFLYLFLFTEDDVNTLMETNHVMTMREANEARCDALATRAKLSMREKEVLLLYSQGKTLKAISEELFLSENTVSMYRRKLYAKLKVHSKQELLDLLEQEERTAM